MYSFSRHNDTSRDSDIKGGLSKGHGNLVKTKLEDFKGYYILGDSYTIKKASKLDLELKETYAIDIVSNFHHIIKPLIHLEYRGDNDKVTNSTITYTYYAMVGKVVLGKIEILVQDILIQRRLQFVYYYKDSSRYKLKELHRERKPAKVNQYNDEYLVRKRKQRSLKLTKYKEK